MKKSIQIRQRDISDCGAACLASVLSYYGLQLPISRIRQYAGTDKRGTSLQGLIDAAQKLKFRARGAKASGATFRQIPMPAIFHLVTQDGLQHFVVVYKITDRHIWFMDPAFGKIFRTAMEPFKRQWSGVVLLLFPSHLSLIHISE